MRDTAGHRHCRQTLNGEAKIGKDLADEQVEAIADTFTSADFTPEDLGAIKATRRRSPQPDVDEAGE